MVVTELMIFGFLCIGVLALWQTKKLRKIGVWLATFLMTYIVFQLGQTYFTNDGELLSKTGSLIKSGILAVTSGFFTRIIIGYIWNKKMGSS